MIKKFGILDYLPNAFCLFNSNGKITEFNKAFEKEFIKYPPANAGNIFKLLNEQLQYPLAEQFSERLLSFINSPAKEEENISLAYDNLIFEYNIKRIGKSKFILVNNNNLAERLKNEELLKERERYKQLLDSRNEMIVRVNSAGEFLFVNETYKRIFGIEEKDIIGHKFIPLVHPDDREHTLNMVEGLVKSPHRVLFEQRAKTPDGWRWIEWEDVALLNDKGEIEEVQGIGRDITDKKINEIELKKHREKLEKLVTERTAELKEEIENRKKAEHQNRLLRQAVENSDTFISITDKENNFIFVNRAFHEAYGYTKKELLGKTPALLRIKGDKPPHEHVHSETLKGGWSGELLNIRKNGEIFPVYLKTCPIKDDEGEVIGLFGITQDLTEMKKTAAELEKSKKYFETLITSMNEGFSLFEKDGTLKFVNDKLCRMLGYERDEVLKMKWKDLFVEENVTISPGKENNDDSNDRLELTLLRKDNLPVNVIVSFKEIGNEENGSNDHFAVLTDITARKQLEEELLVVKQSVQRSLNAVLITDSEGKLVYINSASLKMWDYKEDEITGENFLSLWKDRKSASQIINSLKDEGEIRTELTGIKNNGEEFTAEIFLAYVYDSAGNIINHVASVSDITLRKEMEEKILKHNEELEKLVEERTDSLNESNNHLKNIIEELGVKDRQLNNQLDYMRKLIDSIPYPVFIKDTGSNVFDCNLAYATLYNTTPKQISGIPAKSLLEDEAYIKSKRSDNEIMNIKQARRYEIELNTPDGRKNFLLSKAPILNKAGFVEKIVGILTDITQLKLTESKLIESESRFRQLAENIDDALWLLENNSVLYVSPAYSVIFGRPADEIYRDIKSFMKYVHPDDKTRMNEVYFADRRQKDGLFDEKFRIVRPNGETRWLWIRTFPIIKNEKELRIVGIIKDITVFKQAEVSVLQSLEKEKQLNKLKSKFITTASHEFRTPLTTIQSSADLIDVLASADNPKVAKHVNYINRSVEDIVSIIENILTLSKSEDGKISVHYEKINITDFCNSLVNVIREGIAAKYSISTEFLIESKYLITDPKHLKIIFNQLINNAVNYSAEGSKIIFRVKENDRYFIFEISDEGTGITEKELQNIFEPFYRGLNSQNSKGSGLGLSIVKSFVDSLNGKIEVKSVIDEGSEFIIFIPKGNVL